MFWHIVGLAGMALIVLCYWNGVSGKWSTRDEKYLWTNMTGAILLTISLCFHFNLGSFLIEMFWIAISVSGLIKNRRETC